MPQRSEEDVVAGVLRIEVGDGIRAIPTLKARWVGEWMALFGTGAAPDKPLGDWSETDVLALPSANVDQMLDLIVAYDRTGALGGRDWLLENADPDQLRRAVEQMLENANPFVDAPGFLGLFLVRRAAASDRQSSTSGRSRTGASTRTRSASGSTRSS